MERERRERESKGRRSQGRGEEGVSRAASFPRCIWWDPRPRRGAWRGVQEPRRGCEGAKEGAGEKSKGVRARPTAREVLPAPWGWGGVRWGADRLPPAPLAPRGSEAHPAAAPPRSVGCLPPTVFSWLSIQWWNVFTISFLRLKLRPTVSVGMKYYCCTLAFVSGL